MIFAASKTFIAKVSAQPLSHTSDVPSKGVSILTAALFTKTGDYLILPNNLTALTFLT
jgi:hypothetical protein